MLSLTARSDPSSLRSGSNEVGSAPSAMVRVVSPPPDSPLVSPSSPEEQAAPKRATTSSKGKSLRTCNILTPVLSGPDSAEPACRGLYAKQIQLARGQNRETGNREGKRAGGPDETLYLYRVEDPVRASVAPRSRCLLSCMPSPQLFALRERISSRSGDFSLPA